MAYELSLRPFYHYGYKRSDIPLSGIVLAGSISGSTYWAMIYPIDTIKSIVQTDELYSQNIKGKGLTEMSKYFVGLFKYILSFHLIYRKLGFRGLYNSLFITLCRAVPANTVLFMGYEYAFRYFSKFLLFFVCCNFNHFLVFFRLIWRIMKKEVL